MTKTKGLLFTAGIVLAMAFTFSCSDDGGGGGTCSANFSEVQIGTQTWASKNLDCDVGNNKCYNDDPANCDIYGRLYDWNTAMTACPSGWHLPSNAEWLTLIDFAGGEEVAGGKLKSTSGWSKNGTDEFGFSALPGGNFRSSGFGNVGNGLWWTATELNAAVARLRIIEDNYNDIGRSDNYKSSYLCSVRCIKD